MNNEKLESIAKNILKQANLYDEERYGFAITILMIISIVLTCIRIIQECNKNKTSNFSRNDLVSEYKRQIIDFSKARGWFTKMRIKKIIRREMTPEDYRSYANALLNAILDYGETLTEEETITLMEAANV